MKKKTIVWMCNRMFYVIETLFIEGYIYLIEIMYVLIYF